ncbi:MAG: ComEA family DNA-binding protein [Anaerolineales bacterium]|jgi:competence protein ComEA|nr:ComEA family DNA-binding protein [Anaerolineales bacterium]NTW12245.1 ComEA family DNA-binding protein [Anaerolineales bacterium]
MQSLKSILNVVSGILFGLFVAALIWVVSRNPSGEAVTLRPVPTDRPIVVHITGAVPRPGVYALPEGARVQDVISAAGGFLAEADKEFINLAQVLEDGERLDIPYAEGFSPVIPTPIPDLILPGSDSDLININTAAAFELESLPGIGPTTAQKIIEYRDANGPFLSTEDIINVSGIGPGTYDRIKDLITVGP